MNPTTQRLLAGAASSSSGPTDPYFSNVSLLLHADGTNGSQSFVDSSSSARSVTVLGNAQISTSVKKYGTGSAYFDGADDHLRYASSSAFDLAGTFTIECFVYLNSLSSYQIITARQLNPFTNGLFQFRTASSALEFVWAATGVGSVVTISTASGLLTTSQWTHVAVSCSNGNVTLFVGGVVSATGSISGTASPTQHLTVGALDNGGVGTFLNGYVDEFRFTKGVARYTGNFTPPSEAFPNS